MNKHLPGDVIERLEIFSVPVEVGGVEEVWGEVDDVTEGEDFSRLFQDFALRHLHVASGLQVVAQELDGVDQLVETRKNMNNAFFKFLLQRALISKHTFRFLIVIFRCCVPTMYF